MRPLFCDGTARHNVLKTFLSIGECMVELSDAGGGLLRRGFAGDTFNTAWYARKLLPPSWQVSYFTSVGEDALSDEMVLFTRDSGIDTSHISRLPGLSPGLYMISLKNGERSFSYWRDTSAARLLARDKARLRDGLNAADVIYFSGITLAILNGDDRAQLISEVALAKARGAIVAFDTNYRPRLWSDRQEAAEAMRAAAKLATIVLPGLDDEQAIYGPCRAAEVAARYGDAEVVVVKDGRMGATVFANGLVEHVPAVRAEVVDTTAAGDSFCAGFLSRFIQGDDAVTATRFAAEVAAQVVSARGALVEIRVSSSGS